MTIYSAALMGTYEEFLKIFKEGDQNEINASRESLLFTALCNTNSKERYKIANFLINKGADVKIITEDGMSMFFPLFSYGRQDIVKTTILCKTLLEKGADITTIYKKERTVSFKTIFNTGTSEMEMLP